MKFETNLDTKKITSVKTVNLDTEKTPVKFDFVLGSGNIENEKFKLIVSGIVTTDLCSKDENVVSFRYLNLPTFTVASSTKDLKIQKLTSGAYVDVISDQITFTKTIQGGGGTGGTQSDPIYTAEKATLATKTELNTITSSVTNCINAIENAGSAITILDNVKANASSVYTKTEIDSKFTGIDTILDNIIGE